MATSTAHLTSPNDDNRFDFLPFMSFLPFEWRNLGTAFSGKASSASSSSKAGPIETDVSGRCAFTVRQGYDPSANSTTGRVLEGDGDLGFTLKTKGYAIGVTLSNLSMRKGLDNPIEARSGVGAPPSMKAMLAKEVADDTFVGASFDLKLRKPEISILWTGDTFTEKATVCIKVDPIHRALSLGAAVSFPGTEWRDTVYDEVEDVIEEPKDDGGRHRFWVRHEAKRYDLMHRTAVGATLDLGRIVNFVCDFVDYKVEPRLPPLFWAIPFSQKLYNLLVPAEDDEQVRHHIKGWDLEASHEFGRQSPKVALVKSFKYSAIRASWDQQDREAGLEYCLKGVKLGARLRRVEGLGWQQPTLTMAVEPLSFFL